MTISWKEISRRFGGIFSLALHLPLDFQETFIDWHGMAQTGKMRNKNILALSRYVDFHPLGTVLSVSISVCPTNGREM